MKNKYTENKIDTLLNNWELHKGNEKHLKRLFRECKNCFQTLRAENRNLKYSVGVLENELSEIHSKTNIVEIRGFVQ